MKITTRLAPVALWLALSPLHAATTEPAKSTAARPDDLVCITEMPVGSHMPRRICETRVAHEERTKQDQDKMNQLQRSGSRVVKQGN